MSSPETSRDFGLCLRRFAHDRDGGSAVEFAIVLPFMLTLYIGGVELGKACRLSSRSPKLRERRRYHFAIPLHRHFDDGQHSQRIVDRRLALFGL